MKGPAECFTGAVRIDPLFLEPDAPSRVAGSSGKAARRSLEPIRAALGGSWSA